MAATGCSQWLTPKAVAIVATLATLSASTAISLYFSRKRLKLLGIKIKQLEISLNSSLAKFVSERQGRIRAQKELRDALSKPETENSKWTSYPMRPIGVVQSCFSTRNGTPRQPLLVTLARACLVFDSAQVPPASLEGLGEYSHCWVIYVFHLNTDLEKLWKQPSRSKFKAKVRVPRLKGGRMGVFATRSPHRPCPIGLTVAKVEAVEGNMVLLSGMDLVDGTPILDVKPYLPYCDNVQGATVPGWVMVDDMLAVASVNFSDHFLSSLVECWKIAGKKSLYASPQEFQSLIKQVLSWDIRSVSQRKQPNGSLCESRNVESATNVPDSSCSDNEADYCKNAQAVSAPRDVLYHLILEVVDVSYRINSSGDIVVEKAKISSYMPNGNQRHCSYLTWTGEFS